ncbi:MAG: amidohydrolase family protein [Bdellovibrionales bacterium]|nr:amidohydrolase family protein [Bdellovibrionales bacterium]
MALPPSFAIQDVEVWNADGVLAHQDLVVRGGVITEMHPTGTCSALPDYVFPGGGQVLMPSGVDNQVHLRAPGQPHKDLPECGLRAALRGGVGALLTMPNTVPVIDSVAALEVGRAAVAKAEYQSGVKVLWSAAMTLKQEGQQVVDVAALKRAGVAALTDDGRGVARDEMMRQVFEANEGAGLPLLQHAEVPGHGCALAAGPEQARLGLKAYPPEAEWRMVERDLALLAEFPNQRYHVLHVSAAKTLDLVAAAQARGLKATAEVSPHHLLYSSDDIRPGATSYKMNPPLRSVADREALRAALFEGRLDFVATDHAPHEPAAKGTEFAASAFGTTGLEAFLRVLLLFVEQGLLKPTRLVQVFSTAPAQFLGIGDEFGAIRVGRPLRAILVDVKAPDRPLVVEELESQSKNSCFLGARLPGAVRAHFNSAGVFRF